MNLITKRHKLRAFAKRLWWWGFTRFPAIVPELNPLRRQQMGFDNAKNEATAAPKGETLDLLCFWALEVYGPAEIDQLYAGLHKLGWDNSWRAGPRENCIDWVKRQRQRGRGGSCSVGIVNGKGRGGLSPDGLQAELPDGVEYLCVKLHQICPSLTGVQILFVLEAECRGVYTKELNTDRTTTREPIKSTVGAYVHLDPFSQKTRSIEAIRVDWQERISDWVSKSLPGLFCSIANRGLPTAECVMTDTVNILEGANEKAGQVGQWRSVLTSRSPYDVWKNSANDAIYIASIGYERDDRSHFFVSVCQEKISEATMKSFGGRDAAAVVSILWETLDRVLVQFGILAILNSFRHRLMLVRDTHKMVRYGERRAIRALDDIQKFFESDTHIPGILSDLKVVTAEYGNPLWWGSGFAQAEVKSGEQSPDITDRIRNIAAVTVERVIGQDQVTRDGLKQLSDVVSARVSVRAQRTMRCLTWWIIVLSVMTLFATVLVSPIGTAVVASIDSVFRAIRS